MATIEGGQNLNFAIPIDYARGMLTISQTQPLASIYEPEPTPEPAPKAPEATPATAAAHLNIPDEIFDEELTALKGVEVRRDGTRETPFLL